MPVRIRREECTDCGTCREHCPGDIFIEDPETGEIRVGYPDECWTCGACAKDCPNGAIELSLWWKVSI